jgi:uncharacterized damage-inducible protein DinB
MNPLRIYEYLETARAKVFDAVRPLSAEQYGRAFPIGLGSLARTLTHIMICEFAYVERIQGRDLKPYATWPIQDEKPPAFAVLESAWRDQANATREALAAVPDWSKEIEYRVSPESSSAKLPMIITATCGDLATQMVMHEIHHRAQALFMLRQLGTKVVGGIDYNAMMYQRRGADGRDIGDHTAIEGKHVTLNIERMRSTCLACGHGADPDSQTHDVVPGSDRPSCGKRFAHVTSVYGDALRETVMKMRPDLKYVSWPATTTKPTD